MPWIHIKSFHYLFTFTDFVFSLKAVANMSVSYKVKWWYQTKSANLKRHISQCFTDFLFLIKAVVDMFSLYKLKWWYQTKFKNSKRYINQCFSVFLWNLNSIALHNFSKTQFLITYNCIHKFDTICFSESYLNSKILSSDSKL